MRWLLATLVFGVGGCSALLSTSDYTGPPNSGPVGNGSDAGQLGTDAAGGGGGPDGSTPTGDGSTGEVDARRLRPGGVLRIEQNTVGLVASVDGSFSLSFPTARFNHPTEWLDLAESNTKNLSGAALLQPPRVRIGEKWIDDKLRGNHGALGHFDDVPVRFSFDTYVHQYPNDPDESLDIKRWARFTIHATGRVNVNGRLNGGAGVYDASAWSYNDLGLAAAESWQVVPDPSSHSVAFFSNTTSSSVNLVNIEPETTLAGEGSDRHWTMPGKRFENVNEMKLGEIQFGITSANALSRANDARSPALEVVSGGDGAQSAYSFELGTYVIFATTGDLVVRLGGGEARYRPTFEIKEFSAPGGWELLLNGKMIVSSNAVSTADGVAKTSSTENRILAAYFGTIPKGATAEERTFTFKRK